jgi:hypothetical protein
MRTLMVAVAAALSVSWLLLASLMAAKTAQMPPGEIIYREGKSASGVPLVGKREAGGTLSGPETACVNCHRPSGLGDG